MDGDKYGIKRKIFPKVYYGSGEPESIKGEKEGDLYWDKDKKIRWQFLKGRWYITDPEN